MKFKNILSLLLSAILLFLTPTYVHAASDLTLSFDTAESMSSLTCTDGEISHSETSLIFKTKPTYPPLSRVMLSHISGSDEYYYSCTVSFSSVISDNGFFALVFGSGDSGEYRLSVTRSAFVELCYVSSDDEYTTVFSDMLSSYKGTAIDSDKFDSASLSLNEELRLGIVVKSSYAYIYIEGASIGEAPLSFPTHGSFGFCGRGAQLDVDNVNITYTLPAIRSILSSYESNINDNTLGLTSPFIIIRNDSPSISDTYSGQKRASAVNFNVNALDGVLYVYSDGTNTGTLSERVMLYRTSAVLSFTVSDSASAKLLSGYLDSESIHDCFIISSSEEYIKECLGTGKYRRGVLDVSENNGVNIPELVLRLYSSNMRTVILSPSQADPDTVYALRSRMITVYVKAADSTKDIYGSIACGADGVVCNNETDAMQIISSLPEETVNRHSVAMIKCETAEQAAIAVSDGAGAIYGELSVRSGICYLGTSPLSEVYTAVSGSGCAVYCLYSGTERSAADALREFCISASASANVFLLAPLELAQYTSALDSLYGHAVGINVAGEAKSLTEAVFEAESSLRAINSAYITDSKPSREFLIAAAARGIYVCSMKNTGLVSGMSAYFTSDRDILTSEIKYLEISVSAGTPKISCIGYDKQAFPPTGVATPSYFDGTVAYHGVKLEGEGHFAMQVSDKLTYLTPTVLVGKTQEQTGAVTDGEYQAPDKAPMLDTTVLVTVISVLAVAAGIGIYLILRKKKQ